MKEDIKTDRLLKTKEVMEILKTSSVTLWRLVKKGKIPKPIKLNEGGINLYKESWIQNFIENCQADTVQIPEAKDDSKVPTRRRRDVKKSEGS